MKSVYKGCNSTWYTAVFLSIPFKPSSFPAFSPVAITKTIAGLWYDLPHFPLLSLYFFLSCFRSMFLLPHRVVVRINKIMCMKLLSTFPGIK